MTILKRILFSLLLICSLSGSTFGQSSIRGTVVEASSGKAIPGVNVYLAGTTVGESTDKNGKFSFSTSLNGNYNLVASFVGFKKKVTSVRLKSGTDIRKTFRLEEKVVNLEEVEVKTSNRVWKHRYELFFEQFIGNTRHADRVSIENPWVLNFKEKNGLLIASAQKPLKITNKTLGYRLYVELVTFKWPKYRNQGGAYTMYPKFEEMNAESMSQKRQWKEARLRSYFGSFHHFLKSLNQDSLNNNGFSIRNSRFLDPLPEGKTDYELLSRFGIPEDERKSVKGFKLSRQMAVEFSSSVSYNIAGKRESIFISKEGAIEPNTRDHNFFVTPNGALLNPLSLKLYGYWARERVSRRLPLNFPGR